MIVITGAGGFIGSVFLNLLNQEKIYDIIVYDDLLELAQFKNLIGKKFLQLYDRNHDPENLKCKPEMVIHFGAITNTLESNWNKLYDFNVISTRKWYEYCQKYEIPIIFSSSASIHGNGDGPMNLYAFSKSLSEQELRNACVLRFYNVYGPNEYHKGRMSSTILHWFHQAKENKKIKLFENSHRFFRDFVYVEDVAKICLNFVKNYRTGIFDVGTGDSVSFEQVADTMIEIIGNCKKEYISMPNDLIDQYQINTRADMSYCDISTLDIHRGIEIYVDYLKKNIRI